MSIPDEDILQNDLDAEFRQILYVIKPHINYVNDHYNLEKYKVWLERLSEASTAEKYERNKYLVELANQIHDNTLKSPFTLNPPSGPLPRLKHFQKEERDDEEWPYISSGPFDQKRNSRSKDHSPQKKKVIKPKTVRPFQKLGKTDTPRISENNSWCDLSEVSATSLGHTCGETDLEDNEKKNLSAQHKNEGLKLQEHFLKRYEETNKNDRGNMETNSFDVEKFLTADNIEDRINRKPTFQEVEALKLRMKDLLEVKNALRDTHCLTENRKKTISKLQMKLISLEKKNNELLSLVEIQKNKLMELEREKAKEIAEFKDKFTHLRQKEVEFLKIHHTDQTQELEKAHQTQLCKIEHVHRQEIEILKMDHEEKMKKVVSSSQSVLMQKEEELNRLKAEVRNKGDSLSEQNSEHVVHLKKCISKLDKVMHKSEKEYVKKMEKLKQELEVKEMTSQVQLQTQKADLLVRSTAMKQEELKNALNSLEGKYKKMMENLQVHALESKKHDQKVIEDLKLLLSKHNIPCSLSYQ